MSFYVFKLLNGEIVGITYKKEPFERRKPTHEPEPGYSYWLYITEFAARNRPETPTPTWAEWKKNTWWAIPASVVPNNVRLALDLII